MMKLLPCIVLALLCFVGCGEQKIGICESWFSVVDSKTNQPITNFTFAMPCKNGTNIPGNTFHRGKAYSLFYTLSTTTVTARVSAPGYTSYDLVIEPKYYQTYTGQLPANITEIRLSRDE